ncbi:MAG: class I SAM-dependent methyltransferase [Candidatus Zixiibacteriota bacterium]|nr:MAG: class I SAM-dependent methyltransferase [candidate division Zixibacteria bacterium]
MTSKNPWQTFFNYHAPKYDDEMFVKNTTAEVEFILKELRLPEGAAILDVGCGTGRHTVELARRGYLMTGVDLSEGMLRIAAEKAESARVAIGLVHADAVSFTTKVRFDAALCLCEGAFSLIGLHEDPREHDSAILHNINTALKSGGKLILTAPNALEKIRKYTPDDIAAGKFDPNTIVETYTVDYDTPDGKKSLEVREKGYRDTEIRNLLNAAGFETIHIGGGTAGNWGYRPIDPDEIELMAIACKVSECSRDR